MPLDHSEFIKRQAHPEREEASKNRKKRVRDIMLSFLLLSAYIAGCVTLALALDVDMATAVMGGLLFVIAGILAYWGQRYFQNLQNLFNSLKLL